VAPASITISAAAADADGTVSKVEFYNGSTLLDSDAISPYSFTWNNVSEGVYNIIAKATDNNGLVTTSDAIEISVNPVIPEEKPDAPIPNIAPAVSITSPVTNTGFVTPASITISATAADIDGMVSKVEFYNGSTLLGSDVTSPYSFKWNNVAAGNYQITAKAIDNNGLVTTSAVVLISVSDPKKRFKGWKSDTLGSLSLKVGPNPASDRLAVFTSGFPQNSTLDISILSLGGNTVKTIRSVIANQELQVDISSLKNGVYVIQARAKNMMVTKQFVKM
jgi:hypothetical protein